ncbi:hypothetical protein EV562_11123 [Streptomyces sp. BK208]|uniref:hypothetical protein n=1 Tax=Streptomyces sp. BK208 TaxID=2512150 RepID=UPI0010621503|nr:hypothetical protein [Streptomyces sp. BK208]TDT31417.1 hypothetical protein EV562_11123 [Streptomyces sp. BK208]
MTSAFLSALGGRIAERWLAALALPGLLFLAAAGAATVLGHAHWSDVERLRDRVDTLSASPASHSAGTVVLVALGVLAGAAVTGAAAQVLGSGVELLWCAQPHGPVLRSVADRRLRRWRAADARFRTALVAAGRARIEGSDDADRLTGIAERRHAERDRIASVPPRHPFAMGDRLAVPAQRLWRANGLDLTAAWPHLWLLAADGTRGELQAARLRFTASARLCAWGAGYLVMGLWWWPAALAGVVAVASGVRRGHAAADAFAELTEALADLHVRDLAAALGVEHEGVDGRALGERLTRLLRKESGTA